MENRLGANTFITWHPPDKKVVIGNIELSAGKGVVIFKKTINMTGHSSWPTINLEYKDLDQGELSIWVLFHAFITGDPWTLPSYMGTIHGAVEFMDEPYGWEKDYDDFLNTAYRTQGITQKVSYRELHERFRSLNEQQSGMVKNLLLNLKPSDGWSHSEMADYS